jgi:hypothetical protein
LHFKIDDQILSISDRLTNGIDKGAGLLKVLEHVTADNQICPHSRVFRGIVVRHKANIYWDIVAGCEAITWTETDPLIVSTIAYDAQEVASSHNVLLPQVIGRNQSIRQFFRISAKSRREHLRVLVIYLVIDEIVIVTAVEEMPAILTIS